MYRTGISQPAMAVMRPKPSSLKVGEDTYDEGGSVEDVWNNESIVLEDG